MMARRISTFLMVISFCLYLSLQAAQSSSKIDSLIAVLKTAKDDTNKVNLLNDLGEQLRFSRDNDKAMQYLNEALLLAEKITFKRGVANAYINIGYIYKYRGNYSDALKSFTSCLEVSTKIGYRKGIAHAYAGLADVSCTQGNYPEALEKDSKALQLFQETSDQKGISDVYSGFGNIYLGQGNYPAALYNYMSGLKAAEVIGDKTRMAWGYFSIALIYYNQRNFSEALEYYQTVLKINEKVVNKVIASYTYNNMGLIYSDQGKYPEALKFYTASLKITEEIGDKEVMAESIMNIGEIYLQQGNYKKALGNFFNALQIYKKLGLKGGMAIAYIGIGSVVSQRAVFNKVAAGSQQYIEAMQYLKKGLSIAKEIGDKKTIKDGFLHLSETDSARGDFEKALEDYKIYFIYQDSLFSQEGNIKTTRIKISYETEKRDREIELLGKENEIKTLQVKQQRTFMFASVTGIALLLVVVLVIISSRRRLKKTIHLVNQQKKEIEGQKEALEDTLDKLKQTQSQLIQSEKMASLGMLTAGIAHEINNPVNFINSGAISLQKDYEDLQQIIHAIGQLPPAAQKLANEIGMEELLKNIPQTIEDIKTGVSRTSEIVKGLRNFTRMDALELKEADIHEGIDSTLLLLSHKLKDRISVVKEYDDQIGFIKCYPGPLNQVFMNLLNNAIDAIDQKRKEDLAAAVAVGRAPDTTLTVDQYQIGIMTKLSVEGIKTQVKIVISDNGVGIPDEIRDKLFDPFFTTKEVGKGTGLGLAICHGIIEKHGGNISFESKVNEGTEFTITLPVG